MAYKALYRTYRPQKFSEVIGQNVIVKTLQNAIKNDRVSHAYLFCGPRGTGKTSIARIFAKVLNCANEHDGEPCNECVTCKEISEGMSPDVIEIDAASNNGVDEIRDLKEKVKFLPAGSKYKIYIIDEVHMLSTSAFNALLKTLEEPPKHVIFILATTEPQKVLSTIISRCQRFDFGALNVNELVNALENICVKEQIDYDKNALKIIASASEGGLRDAISLLDQAISLTTDKIDEDVASAVTGLVGKEKLIDLANAIEDKNISECLLTIQELENSGKEVSKIVNSLLGFYRDVLLCKSINASFSEEYIAFASKVDLKKLYYNIDILSNVQSRVRFGTSTSIYLEVAVIKMISITCEELDYNSRLSELENAIKNGDFSSSGEQTSGFDVEEIKRLRVLEGKFNNLLTELSKLELPKNLELLRNLKDQVSVDEASNNQYKELDSKLTQALEDIAYLKATQQTFRNELNNTKSGEVDESTLQAKIEDVLKKSKGTVDFDEVKKYVDGMLSETKTSDIDELSDRLTKVESNIYKVLAGKLSQQGSSKKQKNKVSDRQISMFADEIVDVEDLNEQKITPKTDFKEFSNEEIKEEHIEPVVKEEVKELAIYDDIKETFEPEDTNVLTSNEDEEVLEEEKISEEEKAEDEIEEYVDAVDEDVNVFTDTEFESTDEQIEKEEDTSWYSNEDLEEKKESEPEVIEENLFDSESAEPLEEKEEVKEEESLEEVYENNNSEVEAIEDEIEKEIEEEKTEVAEPVELDEYERYDVKVLERIMNDAFNTAYSDKDRLSNVWKHLTTLTPIEKRGIADMLAEGEIKAVGNHEFVLIYNSAEMCNRVMSRKFKSLSLKLLKDLLNDDFNYFAITSKVWIEKRKEYAEQYFIGVKPRLKPIDDPELKVSIDDGSDDDDMTKKVLDVFGNEVKIKNDSED